MALTLTDEALAAGIRTKISGAWNCTLHHYLLLLFFLVFLEFLKEVSLLQYNISPTNEFLFHFLNLNLHLFFTAQLVVFN